MWKAFEIIAVSVHFENPKKISNNSSSESHHELTCALTLHDTLIFLSVAWLVFCLMFCAVAAAGGGGDVGVRESGARHERSAESCSVRRLQQDRHHRTVRSLPVHWNWPSTPSRKCTRNAHSLLRMINCSFLINPQKKNKKTLSCWIDWSHCAVEGVLIEMFAAKLFCCWTLLSCFCLWL